MSMKKINAFEAKKCADEILVSLRHRHSFDKWWSTLQEEVANSIEQDMVNIIFKRLSLTEEIAVSMSKSEKESLLKAINLMGDKIKELEGQLKAFQNGVEL